ncbi:antitoxin igA-2 [mine drainage metagenome]|uniref:Antitoxin igA-2 n=1 Tax=mine drainage metagenome TaxID=410659 RepID=A0A1J5SCY4_9ZZZZ
MSDRKNIGNDLVEAMGEAFAIASGQAEAAAVHRVAVERDIDVRAIRTRLGLSREQFAQRFHFPARTVQEWEQGRRRPDQSARAYLTVIERNPQAVEDALSI